MLERDCPACGSSSHTEPLSRENEYELVRCSDCRMLFTHTVQTIEGKILHYDKLALERTDTTSSLSPAHYGLANQIKSVGLYERVLQFIVKTIPQGNINFVDVGCAGGLFLLAAQSIDGYHCGVPPRFNVRGISIDPRERSETERNVGCPVVFPDEAAVSWAGWADVVTLMNVLEHVSAPFELLCQLKRILKPGGLLLIDVPNNAVVSLRGRLLGKWPELDLGRAYQSLRPIHSRYAHDQGWLYSGQAIHGNVQRRGVFNDYPGSAHGSTLVSGFRHHVRDHEKSTTIPSHDDGLQGLTANYTASKSFHRSTTFWGYYAHKLIFIGFFAASLQEKF